MSVIDDNILETTNTNEVVREKKQKKGRPAKKVPFKNEATPTHNKNTSERSNVLDSIRNDNADQQVLARIKSRVTEEGKRPLFTMEEALNKMPLLGIFSSCTDEEEVALARKTVKVVIDEGLGCNIRGQEFISFSVIDADFNYTFNIPYRTPITINYNLLQYLKDAKDYGFEKYNDGVVDNNYGPVKSKSIYHIELYYGPGG